MPKNVAIHFWKLFLFSTPVANHECSQVSIMGIGKYHLNWTLLIACQCFYHSSAGKKNHSGSDSNDIDPFLTVISLSLLSLF